VDKFDVQSPHFILDFLGLVNGAVVPEDSKLPSPVLMPYHA
jgi:hypothetical protein